MKIAKYLILVIILALGTWALLPPSDPAKASRLGSDPNRNKTTAPGVKYVLRFNPGPLYLPGVVRENTRKPVQGFQKVADEFEKLFPDTRIQFLGVPGDAREWLVTQLSSGQAPDVIQINVEDVWQDVHKNWWVPLDRYLESPNPFVAAGEPGSKQWWEMFKYPIPTRGTMAPDDHMYCIVLDMIETGVFYNKTVFDRLGLPVPQTWSEFLDTQRKLQQAGYKRPTLVDRTNLADWGVDLVFEQMYGELRDVMDLDYNPKRGPYLHGYLDWDEIIFLHRKGFFTARDPRWQEIWRTLREWRQYMSQDLNALGTDFVRAFVTQEGVMYWGHSQTTNRLLSDPNLGFEWGIFYLPPITQEYSRFPRGKAMCVIGGSAMQYCVSNSAVSDTKASLPFAERIEKSERLKRVIAFLQFLTLPRNCDAVVNEHIALLPNIKGVEPHRELMPFHEFLQRHYSMTKWFYTFDLQFNEVLIRMLELYLNGGMTQEQFVAWMEKNIDTASKRIIRRKDLDLTRLEKKWNDRAEARRKFSELPNGAN